MKSLKFIFILFLLSNLLILNSCLRDECQSTRIFYQYNPVYLSKDELRNGFKVMEARTLRSTGKIYVYGDYLLINEPKEGIHIIDNSNPKNPIFKLFIAIPGNIDLAVTNNILYADNYTDLLAIDISNINSPKLLCRNNDVFKPILIDPTRGLLVDYVKTEITRVLSCNDQNFNRRWFWEGDTFFDTNFKSNSSGTTSGVPGIGGSTSRFTIANEFLYTVDYSDLFAFNISGNCPKLMNTISIGWNIETIYPYEDVLFIGSQNGMFMFGLNDPSKPNLIGSVSHVRTCDPVVAESKTAYISLHGGSACGGYENQLDIVDFTNLNSPFLKKSYPMKSPLGLAIRNNILYLCDDGLKVIDVKNWNDIELLYHDSSISSTDVIVYPDKDQAILIGEQGVLQYDISNPKGLKRLSIIPIVK
ncbi:MAG: hypothetical protein ABI851_02305 [Saprospiraceae bacterium]